ncbi:hypothetical protein ABZ826_23900 [Streptomyces sp. NPDC047515]|uniref:hypothetical protein n=1 Tax=Streptomyces sp. NPDC047515 TaxID=3155380 RepID=UPI00341111B0
MPHSKAKMAEVAERRATLIKLRRAGVPFEDPRILDLGYTTRGAATKDFYRAICERRDEQAAEASAYRQEENERLDALLAAAWPMATELRPVFNREGDEVGQEIDLKAVDTVLKLMDRRAKLNGLDMPVRNEVTGADGGPLALSSASPEDLAALIAATDRLNQDDPGNTATSTPDEDEEGDDGATGT